MKYIGRAQISRKVSDVTSLSYLDVDVVVRAALEAIADEIAQGHAVQIRGFGTFDFRERVARERFQPSNPSEIVEVPAHFACHFNPCPSLKHKIVRLKTVVETRETFSSRRRQLAKLAAVAK